MCGIFGFIALGGSASIQDCIDPYVKNVSEMLHHRGPDGTDHKWLNSGKILFGHNRLSIIDLSDAGSQPMSSQDGVCHITYNGETYNFRELRTELPRHITANLRGYSDTEVALEYINYFGLSRYLFESRGMFSFALYNANENSISLVVDRMGEKPLFYRKVILSGQEVFQFASELRSLIPRDKSVSIPNPDAFSCYFQTGTSIGEESLYPGVKRVLPGCMLKLSASGASYKISGQEKWFQIGMPVSSRNHKQPTTASAEHSLKKLLSQALHRTSHSDVPQGIFLSGGVDSCLLAALATRTSKPFDEAFTLGFSTETYDETPIVEDFCKANGIRLNSMILNEGDVINALKSFLNAQDEPTGNYSGLLTFILSRFAASKVKVCIAGDGADELFYGYRRHQRLTSIYGMLGALMIPKGSKYLSGNFAEGVLSTVYRKVNRLSGRSSPTQGSHHRVRKIFGALQHANSFSELYKYFMSNGLYGSPGLSHVLRKPLGNSCRLHSESVGNWVDIGHYMRECDLNNYLPFDILKKTDIFSMSNSLEVRLPYLDADLVSYACSINSAVMRNLFSGKTVLRKVLSTFPGTASVLEGKRGFSFPLADWLAGDLGLYVREIIENDCYFDDQFFIRNRILDLFNSENSIRANYQLIWILLVYGHWAKRYLNEHEI